VFDDSVLDRDRLGIRFLTLFYPAQSNIPASKRFAMCTYCGKDFGRKQDLLRHWTSENSGCKIRPRESQVPASEEISTCPLFDEVHDCWIQKIVSPLDGQVTYFPYLLSDQHNILTTGGMSTEKADEYMRDRAAFRANRFNETNSNGGVGA
jgi:hypothetical protein